MEQFYRVLICMSIETCHLGVYEGYFKPISYVRVGRGFNVKLVGYGGWEERITTPARFLQIISAFHPEVGKYDVGYKCHQLRYLLRIINDTERNNFEPGPISDFDEGGIATRMRFFCTRQYNKDNLQKLRIDFFVLADSTHYFVRNIDVYQVNNAGNINIHARYANLSTAIKSAVNRIITEVLVNDPNVASKLFYIIIMHAPSYWPY